MNKLSATQVKKAKPGTTAYKLFDGGGLFLRVSTKGAKYWRLKYRFQNREKLLSLGIYPDVSLKDARLKRAEARGLLAKNIDPSDVRKAEHRAINGTDSFEAVAREWFNRHKPTWAKSHADKVIGRLETYVFPFIGSKAVAEVTPPDLLSVLRRIEARGALETAHRAKQTAGQIFRYAIATGRAERDPSADLRGALPPSKPKHFASVKEPAAVGALMRAIEGYTGTMVSKAALQLTPLVFLRPGELRKGEWAEVNLDAAEWRIPGKRMKRMPEDAVHIVPLSEQAVAILAELHALTGRGQYIFPGARSAARPMSENTITGALRRLGYTGDEMTAHGFRSMASTLLNEQGWNRDAIERQLAHADSDTVRAAYNFSQHLPERRRMMQAWADYLDSLRRGADVISINAGKAS